MDLVSISRQVFQQPPTLAPNDVSEECILATKVYDWVVAAENNSFTNPFSVITTCPTLLLTAGPFIIEDCTVITKASAPVTPISVLPSACVINGTSLALVTFPYSFLVSVTIRDSAVPTPNVCAFTTTSTAFFESDCLCVPTTGTFGGPAYSFGIYTGTCQAFFDNPTTPTAINVVSQICKEVEVTLPVKLAILAKFCNPRENIVQQCPPFTQPAQCPTIFPIANCDCQGSASVVGVDQSVTVNGTTTTGNETLLADICPDCDPQDSTVNYTFMDTGLVAGVDNSFNFSLTALNPPSCSITPTGESVLVTGVGVQAFTVQGVTRSVSFSLTLMMNTFQLRLLDSAGLVLFDSGLVTIAPPSVSGTVQTIQCKTF